MNPCVSSDACGANALCHVDNHYAICKCPDNYMGDAKVECIPRKFTDTLFSSKSTDYLNSTSSYNKLFFHVTAAIVVQCRSNSECAGTESCFNGLCINPCNCGPNAKCTVTNHYPSCVCLPGYSGNPQIGCVQCKYSISESNYQSLISY